MKTVSLLSAAALALCACTKPGVTPTSNYPIPSMERPPNMQVTSINCNPGADCMITVKLKFDADYISPSNFSPDCYRGSRTCRCIDGGELEYCSPNVQLSINDWRSAGIITSVAPDRTEATIDLTGIHQVPNLMVGEAWIYAKKTSWPAPPDT